VSITFVEGKVVARTGAFTLAVPILSEAANIILEAVRTARDNKSDRLFPWERNRAEKQIHITFGNLDLRAPRRTGLSRLALAGCELDTLLQISRHSSVRMLEVYLRRGLMHVAVATKMENAFSTAWNSTYELPVRFDWVRSQILPQGDR
jgi:hypothetical protein